MEPNEIKIGDKFFMFDENRRIYKRDENGKATRGPTFRGYFYEVTIEGETSRSWITDYARVKVPKSSPFPPLYTEAMIEAKEFMHYHASDISRAVLYCRDHDKLRKIAEIVGYDEETRSVIQRDT